MPIDEANRYLTERGREAATRGVAQSMHLTRAHHFIDKRMQRRCIREELRPRIPSLADGHHRQMIAN